MEGVVVVVIGQYVWYSKGQLTKEDIEVLKVMHDWNRRDRQCQIKESPYSQESQVLQKIFRYNKDGQECADLFERIENPSEHGPCHVVIFKN